MVLDDTAAQNKHAGAFGMDSLRINATNVLNKVDN